MCFFFACICVCGCVQFRGRISLLFEEKHPGIREERRRRVSGIFRDLHPVLSPRDSPIPHSGSLSKPMNVTLFLKPAPHSYNQRLFHLSEVLVKLFLLGPLLFDCIFFFILLQPVSLSSSRCSWETADTGFEREF